MGWGGITSFQRGDQELWRGAPRRHRLLPRSPRPCWRAGELTAGPSRGWPPTAPEGPAEAPPLPCRNQYEICCPRLPGLRQARRIEPQNKITSSTRNVLEDPLCQAACPQLRGAGPQAEALDWPPPAGKKGISWVQSHKQDAASRSPLCLFGDQGPAFSVFIKSATRPFLCNLPLPPPPPSIRKFGGKTQPTPAGAQPAVSAGSPGPLPRRGLAV